MDFELKLGQNEFTLTYLFKNDASPREGYLFPIPDLALLKVELDSFQENLDIVRDFVKKECILELSKCQKDAHDRYKNIVLANEALTEKLKLQTELYEEQKTRTILYSISSVAITTLASVIVVKVFY
jgi:hypothetical protein